ncbi:MULTISPECIES: thermostable hemolysin [Pseudoalteromonas]|uniref:thermostable hemolysin n=1 Tax=Pseudoalteromonas TaxID=53246 RepID=UPI0006C8D3D2|nr:MULTISPECIES: thermostable hemolysin [Pseudoalteromonas]
MHIAEQSPPEIQLHTDPTFVCVTDQTPTRARIESTIKAGFAAAFNAQVQQFMPLLCELQVASDTCTLGLRCASTPLFIEQYLPTPIEHFVNASRQHIYELGNLCSSHRRATLAHFVVVNEALYNSGTEYLVFCATRKVRALLKVLGINCTEIALANSHALLHPADWGSYYDNQPTICVVDLKYAHECILNTPALFNIKQQYIQATAKLLHKLETL